MNSLNSFSTVITKNTCMYPGRNLLCWLYENVSCANRNFLVTHCDSCQQGNFTCHFLFYQVPALSDVKTARKGQEMWTESRECQSEQAYIPIEKIIRTSKQSASTSWQCNTSGNRHQPATYGDLCLKWQLKGWHYIISTKKERTSKARSSFGGKIAQGLIHILPILNTYKKVVIMNCSKPLDKGH